MIANLVRLLALAAATLATAAPAQRVISRLDLSPALGAPPGWSFRATQDPVTNVEDGGGNPAPGAIHLCISRDGGRACRPSLDHLLDLRSGADDFSIPRYLESAGFVRPTAGRALLLIRVSSMLSGDGDARVATAAFAYDRVRNSVVQVYAMQAGHNRNEEVRYIANGPLRGAIISAHPTENAPYGYWIAVDRQASSGQYRQVLRYRSATHYGDGNPLGVIDSEMPAIQQRLGLWRPGRPLPLPAHACARPHMVGQELWC